MFFMVRSYFDECFPQENDRNPENASLKWQNGELTGDLIIVCILIIIISYLPFVFFLLLIFFL